MEKKTIVDELRAEVASIQKALNLIVSKIELYEAEMNVKETTQQATILGLKQTIAELQEKMLREKISGEFIKGELKEEKEKMLGGSGELKVENGEKVEGSGEVNVENEEMVEEKGSVLSGRSESPSRDARIITDLRKAIGLNDRFRFKHDLFQNNEQLLLDTIDALNAMETMADAQVYLKEHFAWDAEDATVVYFYELLARKFV